MVHEYFRAVAAMHALCEDESVIVARLRDDFVDGRILGPQLRHDASPTHGNL